MRFKRKFRKSFKRRSVRRGKKTGRSQKFYTVSRGGIRL